MENEVINIENELQKLCELPVYEDITLADVDQACKEIKLGKAGGADGLDPEHFRYMLALNLKLLSHVYSMH